eukprot:1618528-Pleurochrysis_carterae.AAC.4
MSEVVSGVFAGKASHIWLYAKYCMATCMTSLFLRGPSLDWLQLVLEQARDFSNRLASFTCCLCHFCASSSMLIAVAEWLCNNEKLTKFFSGVLAGRVSQFTHLAV